MRKHNMQLLIFSIAFCLFHQSAGADQKKWDIERIKDANGNIVSLKILNRDNKSVHQELRDFTATHPEHVVQGGVDVILRDINFDGNDDILVFESQPLRSDVLYLYWIYNPVSDKFECTDPDPHDNLCRIDADELDHEKQVVDFYTDNAVTHGTRYQIWKDGKLITVKEIEEVISNSGKTKVTERELKNGKLAITKQYIK